MADKQLCHAPDLCSHTDLALLVYDDACSPFGWQRELEGSRWGDCQLGERHKPLQMGRDHMWGNTTCHRSVSGDPVSTQSSRMTGFGQEYMLATRCLASVGVMQKQIFNLQLLAAAQLQVKNGVQPIV